MIKARERFKQRKAPRRNLVEAVNKMQANDNRLFTAVEINKKILKGLLDTGSSVSLLERGCRELVEDLAIVARKHFSSIKTAGGENFYILGKLQSRLCIKIKQKTFHSICVCNRLYT